ncbi:MAG: BrnT family toxin [Sulfurovum sp.]|nr:MAG: BrnT family toxin [Sulfurovum sp.]
MKTLKFSWDELKAKANIKKHDVSFEEAKSVFDDEFARLIPDPDHSINEERFILLGSSKINILTVVHCYRENDEVIRIISARKSTNKETKLYKEFLS